ncbi:MAG: hypothetical protein EOM68_16115, partial [Spirochaetia bacterium]|nr:hypothetical protein [Spirochaetia bacterium]
MVGVFHRLSFSISACVSIVAPEKVLDSYGRFYHTSGSSWKYNISLGPVFFLFSRSPPMQSMHWDLALYWLLVSLHSPILFSLLLYEWCQIPLYLLYCLIGGTMQEILRRYARLIIEIQLKLQRGDALSINTENSTIGFARMLATQACESTLQTVSIVETSHGKITQVVEFDPLEKRIKRPPVTGFVMCHLIDLDNAPYLTEDSVSSLTEEVAKLGTYGLLSEPVFLDRRIAVPWANVPLPGPLWTMQLLGKAASEEDMWNLFAKIYRLEDDHGLKFWLDQANLLHYRKQMLTKRGKLSLTIKADGCNLQATMADRTKWTGGSSELSSGRTFMPNLPMQHIHASLHKGMTEGTLVTSIPFLVLGKMVKEASFTIEKGKVVAYSAKEGKEALDAFFAIDEGSHVVSGLSLA